LSSCVCNTKHLNANSSKHGTLIKDISVFLVAILYSYFITKEFESSVIIEFCVYLCSIGCLSISVNISDFSEKYRWSILHECQI